MNNLELYIVHIAGAVENGNFQACKTCHLPLIDYRSGGVMTTDGKPPCFWEEDARIAKTHAGFYFKIPDESASRLVQ